MVLAGANWHRRLSIPWKNERAGALAPIEGN
jgi:hypothetical protein